MTTRGYLSEYFTGAGVKILRGTEIDPTVSHGHEFQGVDVFREFLGTPLEKQHIPVTYVWMDDEHEEPDRIDLTGTWYDSRRAKTNRNPEYRLYYPAAARPVVYQAREGDRLFLCMTPDDRVLAILCPANSTIEQKLLWLFGLSITEDFLLSQRKLAPDERSLDLASRFILGELGIEPPVPEPENLERLVDGFGLKFPGTVEFSAYSRSTVDGVDPREDPDAALVAWMEREEALFRALENRIVSKRLQAGFTDGGGVDVEGFISFSLSVHNRRKSRAGWAFGHHVEAILRTCGLRYTREATTEKRNAADFLFPGEREYADHGCPDENLAMLAVKTSCKDRWRQVLAEAARVRVKHLLTLEPAISGTQTSEMRSAALQLVLPASLHSTYLPKQQEWLMDVKGFLSMIAERQR